MPAYTLKQLHENIKDSVIQNCNHPENVKIDSLASLNQKKENAISYVSSKKYISDANSSSAVAIFTNEEFAPSIKKPTLVVKHIDFALIEILKIIYPEKPLDGNISKTAIIHPSAKIGKNCSIGDYVTIAANCVIGDNCIIHNGCVIEADVVIGNNSSVGANNVFHHGVITGEHLVTFGNTTLGSDGFRFVAGKGMHHKVPHIGGLSIGNFVEIGSNCSVDRGVLEDTIIGDHCKFDNQVHIAHNCILGKNVLIAANSAVAGSTKLGDNVIIGGCSAIADHLEIAADTIIAGGTGIRNSITEKNIYAGAEFGLTFADFQKLRVNIKHVVGFQNWAKRIKNIEKKTGIQEIND